ncbi:MAG: DUF1015 domain-containing protein [Thermoplasmata archaeon]
MVEVLPFKGIRYSLKELENLVTEPYDKISKEMQRDYYKKNPYNFIRLNLPDAQDPYNSSRDTLKKWLDSGILVKDENPYFYQYIETFNLFGREYTRHGFFAIVKLEDYSEKKILPHERTFKGPKEDRLKMLRATNTDLEPVFFLYDDPENFVQNTFENKKRELEIDVIVNGIRNRIYKIKNDEISKFFENKQLVIADGHHRYETALAYAKEKGFEKGTGYIMAVLVNRQDPGLVILPSHRVIKQTMPPEKLLENLKKYFTVNEISINEIRGFLNQDIVFCYRDHAYSLNIKKEFLQNKSISQNLNVSYLNSYVINEILNIKNREEINFERWPQDVLKQIENENKYAFLVKPVNPTTVWNVAMNGEIMPEKSTDFYPKLMSGFKLFDLNDAINKI